MNRYSLSIGISEYHQPQHRLNNPCNDARRVAYALQTRGFEVDIQLDANLSTIESSLEALRRKVEAATDRGEKTFSLIYFAGHAVEVNGASFMLPADFPEQVAPSTLGMCALSATAMIDALASGLGPKILIIDACRVPTDIWSSFEISRFSDLVSAQRQQFPRADNAHELLVAFSTSPGSTAGDGLDGNSVYCIELCKALLRHGVSVDEALASVGQQVISKTQARQRPWYLSSLTKRAEFTDLPAYRLIYAAPTGQEVYSRSRVHARAMDDTVIYHDERTVFQCSELDHRQMFRLQKDMTAIAVHEEYVFVIEEDGELYSIRGEDPPDRLAQVDCKEVFGIEVAPSGDALVIFGISGYVVLICLDGVWGEAWVQRGLRWSVYGAVFRDADSLFVCGSGGTLRHVWQLRTKPKYKDLKTNTHSPLYDLKVLVSQGLLIACCAHGLVKFFDLTEHKLLRETNLGAIVKSLPSAYHCLRDVGLSSQQALEFLDDPERFKLAGGADGEMSDFVAQSVPSNDLVCCAVTWDPRVIAVGSSDGFVYLIDARDGELFCTLDAGGSRGGALQWLCCSVLDGSVSALSTDGVMFRFGCFQA